MHPISSSTPTASSGTITTAVIKIRQCDVCNGEGHLLFDDYSFLFDVIKQTAVKIGTRVCTCGNCFGFGVVVNPSK